MIQPEDLNEFIGASNEETSSSQNSSTFDMERYIELHGFIITQRKVNGDLTVFTLNRCPYDPNHNGTAAAFTLRNGRPGFKCMHDSCSDKTIKDVFKQFPPPADANKYESDGDDKRSQADLLCELADDTELFLSTEGECYARVLANDHHENWPLRKKRFKEWLTHRYYKRYGKPPRTQALQEAICAVEAKARFEGPKLDVFIRVAHHDGAIYIDLCDADWQAIEVTSSGWRLIKEPPVMFRRTAAMEPLPAPAVNGTVNDLRRHINIGNDENWKLCLGWLVAALRPIGPYPVLILQGEQGSAKTSMMRCLRRIIDPSSSPVRAVPKEQRDLFVGANNSWLLAYDNLSTIPDWLSDSFCTLATGGGMAKRELYTDGDEVFFNAKRPIILNGIDHLPERADLADRTVILRLHPISDRRRQDEEQLNKEFERDLPSILGGLCTALSVALANLPRTHLEVMPRMADFAKFVTAAEAGLGLAAGDFLKAYLGNRQVAVEETIDADPVGAAIVRLAARETWRGTCQELLEKLATITSPAIVRSTEWPKTPRALSSRLHRLVTFLREMGFNLSLPQKGTNGQRVLTIEGRSGSTTATIATTATRSNSVKELPVSYQQPVSGGMAKQVAIEEQVPPVDRHSAHFPKQLNLLENASCDNDSGGSGNVCGGFPQPRPQPSGPNVCPACGPVDFAWRRSAWWCPECGRQASKSPSKRRSKQIERIKI